MCLERYVVLIESTFLFFWKWTKKLHVFALTQKKKKKTTRLCLVFTLLLMYMQLLVYNQDENACMHAICIIIFIFFSVEILMLIKSSIVYLSPVTFATFGVLFDVCNTAIMSKLVIASLEIANWLRKLPHFITTYVISNHFIMTMELLTPTLIITCQ